MNRMVTRILAVVAMCALTIAYAHADLNDEARVAYQREKAAASNRGDLITEGADFDRIQLITKNLIATAPEMRADAATWSWEVAYIRSSQVNAFCLPGGKIVVFSGLIDRLSLTEDELASVLGHEMGHALLEHGREQYTERQVAKVAVGILGIIAAVVGAKHQVDPNAAFNASIAVGTLGAEFLVLRPYNRERELAADKYGAELAARAGYDARAAISLQQKMAERGSSIEFLSTHPASETRVQELTQFVPPTTERFASRRKSGQSLGSVVASSSAPPSSVASTGAASPASTSQPQASALLPQDPQGLEVTSDPDAVTGAVAASMTSKYMFNAERYAKGQGCSLLAATMVVRAPTYESFALKCSSGSQLFVRCDSGDCAVRE